MAKLWSALRTEIKNDMNLHGEDFVSDAELLAWANDGIRRAEKIILGLYDKYMETSANLALTTGTSVYALPSGIIANKITHIEYNNGTGLEYEVYYIKRKRELRYVDTNDNIYRYYIKHDSGSSPQIVISPAARETSTTNVIIYFIREAATISSDSDSIDIPIADAYVKQYIKDEVRHKEIGPMFPQQESPRLQQEEKLLVEALNNMIPDDSRDQVDIDPDDLEDIDSYDEGYYI